MASRSVSQKLCPMCTFEAPSVNAILSHVRAVHSHDPNFLVTCGLGGCGTTSRSFSALYSHVYRRHSEVINKRVKSSTSGGVDVSECGCSGSTSYQNSSASLDSADIQCLLGSDAEVMQKSSALFLLKLKEHRRISQVAINDIVDGSRMLFSDTVKRVQAHVKASLAESGIDLDTVTGLDNAFNNVSDPFVGLETSYLQEKFYREKLGLIDPEEIRIGESYHRHQFTGSKRRLVETTDTFYYIPLRASLAKLLKDDSLLEQVDHCSEHVRTDGLIEDFCDGSVFKKHPLFMQDPHALQIVAYYDELELCNPLGSHVKKHKLGIVFYTLANIEARFRSQLKMMNLAVVATVPIVEKHGLDQVLKPFISDLNILSTIGMTVVNGESSRLFKGALLAFLADNLASNDLGGFKKSFSFSFRFCRTCLVVTNSLSSGTVSSDFEKRTLEGHLKHIQDLDGPMGNHYSKTYGINRKSALLDIKYFSIFDFGLPHDAMHDILEGIAPLEIKKLLHYHITVKRSFTLAEYNDRLINFNYGYSVQDKPVPILSRILKSPDQSLKSSASQMLTLLRILPFLVGDKIHESDVHWQCFLLLRKMVDIVLCPVMSKDSCITLKFLVKEHHSQFVLLYGTNSYTPKFHFLLHYPEQILAVGPMTKSWTMRHEAKLSFFKKASHLSNFKNFSLSLANNHQRWICYEMALGKLLHNPIECGPAKHGDGLSLLLNESEDIREYLRQMYPQLCETSTLFRPRWVCKQSTTYRADNTFVITQSDGLDPIFGQVNDVLVIGGDFVLFVLSMCKVLHFDDHYHAYAISITACKQIVSLSALLDYNVYHAHKLSDGLSYISLKYYFL